MFSSKLTIMLREQRLVLFPAYSQQDFSRLDLNFYFCFQYVWVGVFNKKILQHRFSPLRNIVWRSSCHLKHRAMLIDQSQSFLMFQVERLLKLKTRCKNNSNTQQHVFLKSVFMEISEIFGKSILKFTYNKDSFSMCFLQNVLRF